jgi:hypothetical protein
MILFSDIYDRAINLFDDPDINLAYTSNIIQFSKMMYPHLVNGLNLFTNPTQMALQLVSQTAPEGRLELFDGDGAATYTLSTTPVGDSYFRCLIGTTVDSSATYDSVTNAVTFSQVVAVGQTCSVEWYYAGNFPTDFSTVASGKLQSAPLVDQATSILARCLLVAWAEKNKNFLLEIRNILRDTDFDIYSPANSTRSKIEWVQDLREDLANMITKLCWNMRFANMGGKKLGE